MNSLGIAADLARALQFTEPKMFLPFSDAIENLYALPWSPVEIFVNWDNDGDLEAATEIINPIVNAVDTCDPWVKETFGIDGAGEGMVYYPQAPHTGRECFSNLAFKAKGEKHKMVTKKPSASVEPASAESIDAFVSMVLTPARLEQGAASLLPGQVTFDVKLTGAFIQWIQRDIQKECYAELEASGLQWKQVEKAVSLVARKWYIGRAQVAA